MARHEAKKRENFRVARKSSVVESERNFREHQDRKISYFKMSSFIYNYMIFQDEVRSLDHYFALPGGSVDP